MIIEACIDDIDSARNAEVGGAHRVELCQNLADGGTTPSHGLLSYLLENCPLPVFPIIRVRGGGFVYSADEVDVMRRDIADARLLGAHGLVLGALTAEGRVDVKTVARLRDSAGDLPVTFHRAFDLCREPLGALDQLIELGITRVLTSGQRSRAAEGKELIKSLVDHAQGKIIVMAGGGVSEQDVEGLVRETGVREVHIRATMIVREGPNWADRPSVPFRRALPGDEAARLVTDPQRVAAIKDAAERGAGSNRA